MRVITHVLKIIKKNYYLRIKKDTVGYARSLGVRIGERCQLLVDPSIAFGSEPWLVSLGDHVDVTEGCRFVNHEGAIWVLRGLDKRTEEIAKYAPIRVGNNVMIGMNSIIMPNVTIGNNVVIAANSVVTKDIPDNSVYGGVPAKPISNLEKCLERSREGGYPIKSMTGKRKREYLYKVHPEWFN